MTMIKVWGLRIPLSMPGITPYKWVMLLFDSRLNQNKVNFYNDHSLPLEFSIIYKLLQRQIKEGSRVILRDWQEILATLVHESNTDNITRRIFEDSSGIHLIPDRLKTGTEMDVITLAKMNDKLPV